LVIQGSYQDSIDGKADFEANIWSIAYTAGDMSISYGETETITKAKAATPERTTDADAIAVSYSMGSMTIQAQRSEQSRSVAGTAGSTDFRRNWNQSKFCILSLVNNYLKGPFLGAFFLFKKRYTRKTIYFKVF
jgi:hypothetical protein